MYCIMLNVSDSFEYPNSFEYYQSYPWFLVMYCIIMLNVSDSFEYPNSFEYYKSYILLWAPSYFEYYFFWSLDSFVNFLLLHHHSNSNRNVEL
jgi:hypothetical protein